MDTLSSPPSPVRPLLDLETKKQAQPFRLVLEWRVVLLLLGALLLGLFALWAVLFPLALVLLWNAKEEREARGPWLLRLVRDALGWGLLLFFLLRFTQATLSSSLPSLLGPLFYTHRARPAFADFLRGGLFFPSLAWLVVAIAYHLQNRRARGSLSSQMRWLGVQGGALLMLLTVAFAVTQLPPIHRRLLLFDHQLFTPLRRVLQAPQRVVYPLGLGSDQDFLSEEIGPMLVKDSKALRSLCKAPSDGAVASFCYAGLLLQGRSHEEIFSTPSGKRLFFKTLKEEIQPSGSPWLPSRIGWLREALSLPPEGGVFSVGLLPEEVARQHLHEMLPSLERDERKDLALILWRAPWLPAHNQQEDFFQLLDDPQLKLTILLNDASKEVPLSYSFHFVSPFTAANQNGSLQSYAAAHIHELLSGAGYSPTPTPSSQRVAVDISFIVKPFKVTRHHNLPSTLALPSTALYDRVLVPVVELRFIKDDRVLPLRFQSFASSNTTTEEAAKQLQEYLHGNVPLNEALLRDVYQRVFFF